MEEEACRKKGRTWISQVKMGKEDKIKIDTLINVWLVFFFSNLERYFVGKLRFTENETAYKTSLTLKKKYQNGCSVLLSTLRRKSFILKIILHSKFPSFFFVCLFVFEG